MPMIAKILLIEGKRNDGPSFVAGLTKKGFQVETVASGSAALTRLQEQRPDVVVVNAATMRTSGKRICMSLRQEAPNVPIVLILDENADPIDKIDANVVLNLPFTLQKLLNRMKPLLPTEQKAVIRTGPISLDVEQRWVRCNGRQASLTPRLVNLLKTLMEQRGIVIEREKLFSLVWETNYTGDTRTLDVHVSWLRQAVEDDPRHPRYIKTVRGVGYRLDVDEPEKTRPIPPIR
ncbi:MAG TPA: response regulator transcription factor [Longilinea sp.]|nr:response regulator transcription factor [Longilinea sp.]